MMLLIDNYDSFTHNLQRYFRELGQQVLVVRNDAITLADLERLKPHAVVISPGPCTPNEAGVSLAAVGYCAGRIPLLGVCLGHQAIAQHFGGNIIRADRVMHGKLSHVQHNGAPLFEKVNPTFSVVRYHSLMVDQHSLPTELEATAWLAQSEQEQQRLMAFQHKTLPIVGVQFHPESVLSDSGHQILANFCALAGLTHSPVATKE